jgi:hypothetical protein
MLRVAILLTVVAFAAPGHAEELSPSFGNNGQIAFRLTASGGTPQPVPDVELFTSSLADCEKVPCPIKRNVSKVVAPDAVSP